MKTAIERKPDAVEAITNMWTHTDSIEGCRMVNEALQFAIKESFGSTNYEETNEIFTLRDLCMAKCHFMIIEKLNKEKMSDLHDFMGLHFKELNKGIKDWYIKGDHPTMMRPDKYYLSEEGARNMAGELKRFNYENIEIGNFINNKHYPVKL